MMIDRRLHVPKNGRSVRQVADEPSPPVVFVDTTTTFGDLLLRRIDWMQLLTLCAKGEIRLVVPPVVIRESVRHWKRQAGQAVKNANDEIRKLTNSFGLDAGQGPSADLIDVGAHEKYLVDRLASVGAELPGLPTSATVEKLLDRDLRERKPFATSGKGFRDAINWETILEFLDDEAPVGKLFWVSKNSEDFGEGNGRLHSDLIGELDDPEGVILVPSITSLLQRPEFTPLIGGLAASTEELEEYLATAGVDVTSSSTHEFIRGALVHAAERLTGEMVEDPYSAHETDGMFGELDLPGEVTDMTIEHVEADPITVQWQVYESFDATTLLVGATIEARLFIEGFANKADALHADTFEVREWDWNDHVSHVAFTREAVLSFRLRVEEGVGVDDLEFESAALPTVG
ncbi:PIN domain-containing protein [Isoptericola sp. 4D.3]|uniref:PIN domain-containing protein n=1 Tax=Isoptericola peretonis TaxID=2918523 RepID=A0ABT0J088_9MICO|nr:PIN domain-containing protein [Isoptericola sp. 4D.3]